ncbi:MAG: class I adenylate-forming enzyme family protein [Betaproteobacteria bacterium]
MILVDPQKIAAYTQAGWWGERTLWDLFCEQLRLKPQAEAVVDACNRGDFAHGQARRMSWAELAHEVDRMSELLLDLGLARDDVVLAQMPNSVEQFVVYLSCARLGLLLSPVPIQYREHELAHILKLTQARAVVTFAHIGAPGKAHASAAMWLALQQQHPHLAHVLSWGPQAPAAALNIEAMWPAQSNPERLREAEARAAVSANDVFTVCWTSGTEASPKGVPRSHNEWLVVAPSIIEAAQLQPGARLLNPFPLINMAGLSSCFATWLALGATVVQHQPFSLPVFLQQLRTEKIDYTVAPPAILNTLLQQEALLEGIDFKRLNRIGSGSAPLSQWMVQGFEARHGVRIVNYFGSNEGAALSSSDVDVPDAALRAQFFPRAGVDGHQWKISTTRKIRTRLVDLQNGQDIHQAGCPGELRFAGPTIFSGYFRAPELNERAFDAQGYYCTGDLFEIAGEQQQYYRYVGRSKDLVIRGGVNISSEEVESLLMACPGVQDVAVVAVPDAILGEKLCACIVARPGSSPSLAELQRFLRDERKVAVYKLPEYLLPLDSLPRNAVGKILKRELRERARALAPQEIAA